MTTSFRHILAPVDFEPPSRRALEVAADLAQQFDARLTVLHAWDVPAYAYAGVPYVAADVWTALEGAAQQHLDSTVAAIRQRLPRTVGKLTRGPAASEILAAVEREGVDLVVLGTHGRQGLNRVLLGSVAEKVVRASSVPVLTMRE
jgi:nucleotide-binding universal stress UspA family protein